jgi:uncharacterized cupin superfamily protein
VSDAAVTFAQLAEGGGERFTSLRRALGIEGFGMNQIVLEPRQRGRIHRHERQEEVYLVLEGELTLALEGSKHVLHAGGLARVPASVRRQLVNRGPGRLVLLALGAHGVHEGRDGRAWESWDEGGEGRPPSEVPLPADLPGAS